MPTDIEMRVANGRGVHPEGRKLEEAVADFYLLETLANVRDYEPARRPLDRLERDLAREFATYLDITIGGELRHAKRWIDVRELPPELVPFFREVSPGERGKAWMVWSVIRRILGLRALELAEELFHRDGWRDNFGGEAWAQVTSVFRSYLEGRMNRRIFVDRCFALEHNAGCVFSKLWSVTNVPTVLAAHGADDYGTLLHHASESVRLHWRRSEWILRADHDPIWLGVQPTDTAEELWPDPPVPEAPG